MNGGVDVHAHRRYLPPVGARVGQIHARQGAKVLCRENSFIRAVQAVKQHGKIGVTRPNKLREYIYRERGLIYIFKLHEASI